MKGLKRIYDFNTLEIGQKYFVVCGIWSGNMLYCGHVHSVKKFTFTFGKAVEDWKKNWNIVSCKSNLRVYES